MALVFADRILETSTTTGTGAFALGGAVTSFRAFSAVMTSPSDTCYYHIEAVGSDGIPTGEWETGLGTYSASNTLTRTTPQSSSNAGAAVNFSAGTKRVAITPTATGRNFFASNIIVEGANGINFRPSGTSRGYISADSTYAFTVTNGGLTNNWFHIKNADGEILLTTPNTTANAANLYSAGGGQVALLRSTSSLRYKTDVQDLDDARADRLLQLRPVRYRSLAGADDPTFSYLGLVAEEVALIEPRLVHYAYRDSDYEIVGGVRQLKAGAVKVPDGVQYERLTVMLLQLMKRARAALNNQSNRIDALAARVQALETAGG